MSLAREAVEKLAQLSFSIGGGTSRAPMSGHDRITGDLQTAKRNLPQFQRPIPINTSKVVPAATKFDPIPAPIPTDQSRGRFNFGSGGGSSGGSSGGSNPTIPPSQQSQTSSGSKKRVYKPRIPTMFSGPKVTDATKQVYS